MFASIVGTRWSSWECMALVWTSHVCQHCGGQVAQLGVQGLSCKKSQGRHFRHAAGNDKIPIQLELSTLIRVALARTSWEKMGEF